MKNITNIIGELINEGRVDQVKQSFKNIVPNYIIDFFINSDPSGNHKYLYWMCKIFVNNEMKGKMLMVNEMVQKIKEFHEIQDKIQQKHGDFCNISNPKDIMSYFWLDELDCVILKAKTDVLSKKSVSSSDYEKIYDDGKFLIIVPKTKEASCLYGKGTKWCVSGTDKNRFDEYNKNNVFYFIRNKHLTPYNPMTGKGDKWYKIAVQINLDSGNFTFWDASNDAHSKLPINYGSPKEKENIIFTIEDHYDEYYEKKRLNRIDKFVNNPDLVEFGYLYNDLTDEQLKIVISKFLDKSISYLNDKRIMDNFERLFTPSEIAQIIKTKLGNLSIKGYSNRTTQLINQYK
jgi:hypothetical protein